MAEILGIAKLAFNQLNSIQNFNSERKVVEHFTVVGPILGLIFTILFCCFFIYIWIRTIIIAYECSLGDSICAFFFTSIYCFYKLGTLIRAHCAKPEVKSIF